jgi:hypothetical protein
MNRRLLTEGVAFFVATAALFVMLHLLAISSSGVPDPALAARSNGHSFRESDSHASTIGDGVSYYLDDFDRQSGSLNNFIANRGIWCEIGITHSITTCADYNLLSISFDDTTHYGDSGASLKVEYNVEQSNSLASYYESLYNDSTFYNLSSFDEFHFWVKGEGDTIGSSTRFYIRFADKNWDMQYVEIVGASGGWKKKTIDITTLSALDWTQMREVTIIFEHNHDGSGRYAHPLSGTLYFDNMVFLDKDVEFDGDDEFLDLLERRAFHYFWEYADPTTGLIRDRATNANVSSIAANGFGLTAICVAKDRGWITHEEAYNRVLTTLNSFYDDGSPGDLVVSGTHGLFYHFVNIHDGTPIANSEVSTIDSALLMAGVLSAKQCFTETEIVTRATAIYEAADWKWFQDTDGSHCTIGQMHAGWRPPTTTVETDGLFGCWGGYNEGMILYLLAIGSPTCPISATSWMSWASDYKYHWGAYYGYPVLASPALFTHQYSHCWIDFRDKRDDYTNYFLNSVYATLADRAYSKDVWYPDPNTDLWGITPSEGPLTSTCAITSTCPTSGMGAAWPWLITTTCDIGCTHAVTSTCDLTSACEGTTYHYGVGYPPEGIVEKDGIITPMNDGTIAPTAAGGSIVFTPDYSISTLRYMYGNYNQKLWGLYGLKDSLNVRCEPGWFANEYIGINVGAMLIMIENYRSDLVWVNFMRNEEIVEAMQDVGFSRDNEIEPAYFYYREAEECGSTSGDDIRVEYDNHDSKDWNNKTLQIWEVPGNSAVYTVNVDYEGQSNVFFQMRYSDDWPGNKIDVYLDSIWKGSFTTEVFEPGGWNAFGWDDEEIDLGIISPGLHVIRLEVAEDGGGLTV